MTAERASRSWPVSMAWPGEVVERVLRRVQAFAGWRRLAWPCLVVLGVGFALSFSRVHGRFELWGAWSMAVLSTAPLLFIRRWPAVTLSVVIGANLVYVVIARLSWPLTGVISWLVAIAASPLLLRRFYAIALLLASEIAVVVAVFVPRSVNVTPWDASVAEALAALVAWGVGENRRVRQLVRVRDHAVALQLETFEERVAIATDRAAVARELHDIVAHHVSMIAVRSATAKWAVPDLSDSAIDAFDEIAAEARMALDELRAVLGVLRSTETDRPQSPQPSLAQLPTLVGRVRAAGMEITVVEAGEPLPITAATGLCCYRLVQEALTNASRHARGAPVSLEIEFDSFGVHITVRNPMAPPTATGAVASSPGFGLIGLRERVTALGGSFNAGPTATGFSVSASIPATRRAAA